MKFTAVRYFLLALLLIIALIFAGCSDEPVQHEKDKEDIPVTKPVVEEPKPEPQMISLMPKEAYELLQKEPDIIIVDVRTQQERQEARIKGSVAVPFMDIVKGEENLPRDKPLLLVCAVGGRSYGAGLYLLQRGYSRLYNLRGGVHGWHREGLPLESGN